MSSLGRGDYKEDRSKVSSRTTFTIESWTSLTLEYNTLLCIANYMDSYKRTFSYKTNHYSRV